MERYTLTLVAPMKLKGLKAEIESINNYCGKQVFLKVEQEINDLNQLENYISSTIKSNFLIVFESLIESRVNLEKAQEELLEKLRKIRFSKVDSKIIVILQSEKENESLFINELIKLDIQDFFFVNNFSRDDIAGWLFNESRTLKDNLKYLSTNMNKPQKEVVIKEVPKYIEVPVSAPEENRKGLFSLGKKKFTTKEVRMPTMIIGITGAERGAGATTLCLELGNYLKKFGSVAILDKTERNELSGCIFEKIDIYFDGLAKIEINQYDYILIDFGVFFEIGKLSGMDTIISPEEQNILIEQKNGIDRGYCRKMICVCPTALWKLYKADFLINNPTCEKDTVDWIFLFNGDANSNKFKTHEFELRRKIIKTYNNAQYLQEIEKLL
ncbi:MAG: hypothetical protein PHI90_10870 [Clostridia bacterium]|nr:hypothetical protein [Clostridia bacterium]